MKVLLIQPPEFHMITTNVPSVVDEESGAYPPLGLLYVASFLEEHTSHEVEILDTLLDHLSFAQIEEEIRKRKPDVVGIQAMTFTVIDATLTAKVVKKVDPNIPVIFGGPHVFIYPHETLKIPEVDYIVIGEGEETFTNLVQALDEDQDLSTVNGIGYRQNGEVKITPMVPLHTDLDAMPMPARHLIPQHRYYSVLAKETPITTMMTSRGCPMQCIFCDRPHLGKQFRYRSPKSVVDEMEACQKMGIKEIFVYDDTFTIRRDRVLEICRQKIERGIDIHWDVRAHINTISDPVLDALAAAGCTRIHYGVESGTEEITKVIKKGIDLNKTREVFKKTKERGITTLGYFMIGNPTETREQAIETIEYARRLHADFIHLSVATPFPATELYRLGFKTGLYKTDYWREFAKNPTEEFKPKLWEEVMDRDELVNLMQYGYKRFYMRPSYLLKRVLELRSWSEFKRKAKAGVRLLSWAKNSKQNVVNGNNGNGQEGLKTENAV
jgi:anaerobic magnesium-protoporphyrin IX monomethyl ester cyclase